MTETKVESLSVGQVLWLVPYDKRMGNPHEVTVTKVGRKWAEIDERHVRVNIETMAAKCGDYSRGTCYVDRVAWEREQERQATWDKFHGAIRNSYRAPNGVTADQIREAAKTLNIVLA
jgi:hypothetical protein